MGKELGRLLKILGTLEGLAAEFTLMRLQGHMNADVRDHVVSFHGGSATRVPLASQVEVVVALAASMALRDVLLCRGVSVPCVQPDTRLRRRWDSRKAILG
jgi:hypothetical protein